jgi:hypothetical protein
MTRLANEKNANFFRRKLSKIAENCDRNIDPLDQLLSSTQSGFEIRLKFTVCRRRQKGFREGFAFIAVTTGEISVPKKKGEWHQGDQIGPTFRLSGDYLLWAVFLKKT